MSQYLAWLSRTVTLFPELTIFTDVQKAEELSGVNGARVLMLSKSELWPFRYRDAVDDLFREYAPKAKRDITYTNPSYALVQFSKFLFCDLIASEDSSRSTLWVDAGISRFISGGGSGSKGGFSPGKSHFEIDLRHNITPLGRIKISRPGTCRRIVSGTSFLLTREHSQLLDLRARSWVENLLSNRSWDNEQVFLSNTLTDIKQEIVWVEQKTGDETGGVGRLALGSEVSFTTLPSTRRWTRNWI